MERDLPRRGFIMTSLIAGLTLAVKPVDAQVIHTDETGLTAGEVKIPVADGTLPGYAAQPATPGPHPIVLVIEEIFGVHAYMQDVCRRLAKAGYLAVAPELYARLGALSEMSDPATIVRDVISRAPDETVMNDLDSTAAWAGSHGGDAGRMAVVGFCRGGRDTWLYAAHNKHLRAAVAFYGPVTGPRTPIQPHTAVDLAGDLHCPLLGLYGAQDGSISQSDVQDAANRARKAGQRVEIVAYPDAGHGFHADYRPSYNAADAKDAWARMLAWLRTNGAG